MHSAGHATPHATSHSATMSTSAHSPAAAPAAATKGRRYKSKRRGKGARNEAIKDLVIHPNSSWLNYSDDFRRNEKTTSRAKGSNIFK